MFKYKKLLNVDFGKRISKNRGRDLNENYIKKIDLNDLSISSNLKTSRLINKLKTENMKSEDDNEKILYSEDYYINMFSLENQKVKSKIGQKSLCNKLLMKKSKSLPKIQAKEKNQNNKSLLNKYKRILHTKHIQSVSTRQNKSNFYLEIVRNKDFIIDIEPLKAGGYFPTEIDCEKDFQTFVIKEQSGEVLEKAQQLLMLLNNGIAVFLISETFIMFFHI